jgi:putative aldouronate transport system substrate-binding protein
MRFWRIMAVAVCALAVSTGAYAGGQTDKAAATAITDASNVTPPGTFPVVREKVTLRVLMRGQPLVEDFATNTYTRWLEDKTGVHLEWSLTDPDQYQEKMNLVLASGDLPDVLMNLDITPTQQIVYGAQGIFKPLNDLIDKYGDNVKTILKEMPEIRATMVAPGGNMYSLPYVNDCYHCSLDWKMYVYQPWLKKLGLKEPTTPAEFQQMLRAFKDKDPNGNGKADEIPMAGSNDYRSFADVFLMNAFIYDDGANETGKRMVIQNGKIDVVYNKPEWKEGLLYLRGLYAEGLMAPQSFTMDRKTATKLAENPDIAILGAYPAHSPSSFTIIEGPSNRWIDYQPIAPLTGPRGLRVTTWLPYRKLRIGEFAMTKADKHPAATMRWADAQYSLEANLHSNFGDEGKAWTWPQPGDKGRGGAKAYYRLLIPFGRVQNMSWSQFGLDYRTDENWYAGQAILKLPDKEKMYYDVTVEKYEPYKAKLESIVPPLFFTKAQAEELSDMEASIGSYVTSMIARFVTGDADINGQWAEYLKTLDQMNVKRYLAIYQEAYDATNKK